mmetsp:Transcript_29815/g.42539  ORF Transcript_29815/g.42539 Transcript_29815/m.42539 type:complete len:408 (+) Transcript_29815:25-1248(+)
MQFDLMSKPKVFVEFSNDDMESLVAVDCKHPTAYQLTHHLKGPGQKKSMNLLLRGDSSTDAVINAIKSNDDRFVACQYVTTNHFDIDSFLSVWCALNCDLAISYEGILREAARIGDFREFLLDEPNAKDKDFALRIVCWINSVESKLFYEPFESPISVASGERDAKTKFDYFLSKFESVIRNPLDQEYINDYFDEYSRVIAEYNMLTDNTNSKATYETLRDIGLVIVHFPQPMHYYSLFSVSRGLDVVVSCYSDNRYEVEEKYTSFIDLFSRGCLPRVEMQPLSRFLNKLERKYAHLNNSHVKASESTEVVAVSQIEWCSNRVTDSGPILRREDLLRKLTKAERYGHPFERQIYSSCIPSTEFIAIVVSYFQFAYSTSKVASKIDWSWNEIHEFNKSIDWVKWESTV